MKIRFGGYWKTNLLTSCRNVHPVKTLRKLKWYILSKLFGNWSGTPCQNLDSSGTSCQNAKIQVVFPWKRFRNSNGTPCQNTYKIQVASPCNKIMMQIPTSAKIVSCKQPFLRGDSFFVHDFVWWLAKATFKLEFQTDSSISTTREPWNRKSKNLT